LLLIAEFKLKGLGELKVEENAFVEFHKDLKFERGYFKY
tara:strand:- start:5298 stop:5414 length:117 start_codon:yes stop_codon:yes gene_type:complete